MTRTQSLVALVTVALACTATTAHADLLYVSEFISGNIQTFNPAVTNPTPTTFASLGQNGPLGLAFDASGNLYVGTFNYSVTPYVSTIEKFTPGSSSIFASTGVNDPWGVAFDAAGNLYVANQGTNKIKEFTPNGVGSVFASTGLSSPAGMAFDAAGNLYVANSESDTIVKFSPTGQYLGVFASTGLILPEGLAFDAAGNLYVSSDNNTIEKFTPGGVGSVFASTGLDYPLGLTFDSSGNLYVANYGNNTIEMITPGGVSSRFATTSSEPYYLAFGPSLAAVPEPSSLVLACTAIASLGLFAASRARTRRRALSTRGDAPSVG